MATNPFGALTLRDLGDVGQVRAYVLSLYANAQHVDLVGLAATGLAYL